MDLRLRTIAKRYRSTFPTDLGKSKEKGADGLQSPSVNGLFLSKKDKQTKNNTCGSLGAISKLRKLIPKISSGHS